MEDSDTGHSLFPDLHAEDISELTEIESLCMNCHEQVFETWLLLYTLYAVLAEFDS